jgi:tRNA-specific 2-thiouridylase
MEICFVTSGDYRDVVRARGGGGAPGRFVDLQGREVGRHDGVDGFTVGQRKGLPALGAPHYVVAIDAAGGDVTLAPRDALGRSAMFVDGLRWLVDAPRDGEPVRALVKVRARHAPASATIVAHGATARVAFDEPVASITPGQAAVFYDGDRVLGGGWIEGSA